MSKILIVSTYPIKNPQHGGQKRLKSLYEAYKSVGHEVKSVGIYDKGVYRDSSPDDIALGGASSVLAAQNPWTSDIISGSAIYKDREVKRKMADLLKSFAPDVLHLEQPFVYLGLKSLLDEMRITPTLVFGSQNIEGPMKRDILEGQFMPRKEVDEAVDIINKVEKELVRDCDLLVACTESDIEAYIKMGAKKSSTILARNGIDPITTTKNDIEYWQRRMKRDGVEKKILFVASAHPPSITGFVDMVGKGLGFLAFNERILVAGSVSDYFSHNFKDSNLDIGDATFWLRALACGRLSENRLGALLEITDVIILPITEGGGSNLKTAEALLANKKIVATSHALRSFEWAAGLPGVWVADTKNEFIAAIREAIESNVIQREYHHTELVETVIWENQLKEFKERVRHL